MIRIRKCSAFALVIAYNFVITLDFVESEFMDNTVLKTLRFVNITQIEHYIFIFLLARY